eukprot:4706896-Alexandrium_andersonii.AAC.1
MRAFLEAPGQGSDADAATPAELAHAQLAFRPRTYARHVLRDDGEKFLCVRLRAPEHQAGGSSAQPICA